MLVQAFCHTKEQIASVVKMLTTHFDPAITKYQVDFMRNIRVGYHRSEVFDNKDAALTVVENDMSQEFDNVGVYYNSGETIFIRIFQYAKVDKDAYDDFSKKEEPVKSDIIIVSE
jgi:hypothetical protein